MAGHGAQAGRFIEERRMPPLQMADAHKALRLVQGHPILYLVRQGFHHNFGVRCKPIRDLRVLPSALQIQRIRQIPMVQRYHRLNARGFQLPHKALIELNAFLVDFSRAIGQDAGPADREAVAFQPHLFHQGHIFTVAVVVVARLQRALVIFGVAGVQHIPDARPAAILIPGAFHLCRCRCRTPQKVFREFHFVTSVADIFYQSILCILGCI